MTLAIRSPERPTLRAASPSFLPASTAPPRLQLQREDSPEQEEQVQEQVQLEGRSKRRRIATASYKEAREQGLMAVIQFTEARLVNPLTSTSLTSRARDISALGRYNQKCDVVGSRCL